jgi:hypothetical protein
MKSAILLALVGLPLAAFAAPNGPDVTHLNTSATDSSGFSNHGVIGATRAYTLGSYTCNISTDTGLAWISNGTPVLFMEMYRLHNGRLEMIGMSWGKHACCAGSGSNPGCGTCTAIGPGLRAGCLDVYSAGYNSGQGKLGQRSRVNAFTGATLGAVTQASYTAIERRLQVAQSDLVLANFPGARYFVEGTYTADDENPTTALNNASYKPVNVDQTTFNLTSANAPAVYMAVGKPAIYAWKEHGLGLNTPDPSVNIVAADVPLEGRFFAGSKVINLGNGTYRYEYAVFNLNSDLCGGSFSIPMAPTVVVPAGTIGFKDVNYHSGEIYDNTDWSKAKTSNAVVWTSPQTFAVNPSSNALRFGTMYNFWFVANVAPAAATGSATLGMFKTSGVPSIQISGLHVPGVPVCLADLDNDGNYANGFTPDGAVEVNDLVGYLGAFEAGSPLADLSDAGGGIDINDLILFLTRFEAGC